MNKYKRANYYELLLQLILLLNRRKVYLVSLFLFSFFFFVRLNVNFVYEYLIDLKFYISSHYYDVFVVPKM